MATSRGLAEVSGAAVGDHASSAPFEAISEANDSDADCVYYDCLEEADDACSRTLPRPQELNQQLMQHNSQQEGKLRI
ncbi:hypothetical protein WJX73_002825 [Symbiochloris irregularis]|uniref:Uncharacterized protein n=1 Tax=Symbiochloris irregularis TaxID=706552 RepID=A0AAW1NZF0_9CHLO